MGFFSKLFGSGEQAPKNDITEATCGLPGPVFDASESGATKLAAVSRCIDVISDSIAKMPSYATDSRTRERQYPQVIELLNVRPNEGMTPFIRRKMLEVNRLTKGAAYEWIVRDSVSRQPRELIPLPSELVEPWRDSAGRIWYEVTHPYSGEHMRLPAEDVLHYKSYTRDGLKSVSPLRRAEEVITAGLASQDYASSYFSNGGQPSGVLQTDASLGGFVKGADGRPTELTQKDAMRREWEKVHSGAGNRFRVAILDHGLKYTPITATMQDMQWVEAHDVTVQDIANFFGVPLYKLNAGKQSYSSNEQNAIEYVVGTLQPIVTQYEQEQTWRLLNPSQRRHGLELHINMMAELRGDNASRANWYRTMTEIGAYSVNDVRMHEDLPDVPGGDERRASLNYVPLEDWKRLSEQRNTTNDTTGGDWP